MAYLGNQPVVGDSTNTFKLLDDIASFTLTFDGSSASVVSVANDTLTFTNHRFITGQRVVYSAGGGTKIAGLPNDNTFFIIKVDQNTIKLATNASNAASSTAIDLTGVGAGTSHTLKVAFDGVNTKFKATHSNGTKSKVSRAAQISLSINGVIQQPTEAKPPTVGYGVEADSTIVFSSAPQAGDKVFGSFIGEVAPSFDLTDNTVDNFTGDGSTTSFTLSKEIASSKDVLVTLDGVTQYPSDTSTTRAYSVVGSSLIFVSAPADGVAIQARLIGFAGATSSEVTGFYGRTGNVALKSTDDIAFQNASAGIITASRFVGELVGVVTATDVFVSGIATFSGDVGIAGTLTYEDVTNIDSVGIITARSNILVGSGITLSPDGDVFVTGISTFSEGIAGDLLIDDKIVHRGDTNTSIRFPEADTVSVVTAGSEALRINSGQKILIGSTSMRDIGGSAAQSVLQVEGTTQNRSSVSLINNQASASASPSLRLGKTRGTSVGGTTVVQSGDHLGQIRFAGSDGTDLQHTTAMIVGKVNGTVSSNTIPTDICFETSATDNGSRTERLRITSTGQVFIGESVTSSYDAVLLRNTNGNTVAQIVNTNTGSSVQSILQLQVGSNRYVNFAANYTNQYLQIQGVNIATIYHDFNTHIFRTNSGTEGMRLDSAGDLTVKGGQINISKAGALNHLEIGSGQTSSQFAYMDLIGDTTYTDYGTRIIRGNTGANAVSQILHRGTGSFDLMTQDSASLNLYTGSAKRIEFDPNGAIYPTQNGAYFHFKAQNGFLVPAIFQNTGNNVDYTMVQFRGWNNSATGYISTRVNVTTYGTSSDARIKENIVDTSNGIERVKQLRPVQFNFIANKEETMDGFLAQEAKNVVPVSVAGDPDAVDENGNMIPLAMDNSKLVPILTKALQEAIAKIETLETKVSALEG